MGTLCSIIVTANLIATLFLLFRVLGQKNTDEAGCSKVLGQENPDEAGCSDNHQVVDNKEMIAKYLKSIREAERERQYYIARQCFHRCPGSIDLLNELWKLQKESLSEAIPTLVKRDIINDMNSAVALYRNTCDIEELYDAESISVELETLSSEVLKKLREEERNLIEGQLTELDNLTKALKNNPDDAAIIKRLEKLDKALDKEVIESESGLSSKYKQVSEDLVKILTKDIAKEEEIQLKEKAYNLESIRSHKEALDIFEADTGLFEENNFKKGKGLTRLVNLIGGWDNHYLLPSTISYNNTVYGAIFSKLKKEAQLTITTMMVNQKKKPL